MAARPALIKQADLTRCVRAFIAAGLDAPRIVVRPDGSVEIIPTGAAAETGDNPCDRLLRK
ncbi:hypothetical protein LAZ40_16180 [Cereibacter sphaeroides]|uniref:hypothetical protein n=1 Tax=Cereibacter sphaeroides TaxID=1063 RepID=UPI001F2C8F4D|nr:hypothetical protein [Cereibacter sphaeroides]MCE6960563.1 hypothetical protein [Cereibacter sphaeroides]MCE6972756.1 hypothetical protein [Cereibacter sphaeroides]